MLTNLQGNEWLSARDRRTALAALVLAVGTLWIALPATSARADHLDMTLGSNGELYSVKAGLYGTLFAGVTNPPGATTPSASTAVLALDTTMPGAPTQRQLVPSTDDQAVEASPALIYEDGSKTLYVVWVSQGLNTVLKLASYDGSQWSLPITIISNQFATKTPPQLAVTRDSHQEIDSKSGNPVTHHRTVLHVVWSEDAASGLYQAYYAPVIFEDGAWIGNVVEPTHLNSFDAAEQTAQTTPTGSAGPFSTPLVYTPAVQTGRDSSTAVTGFASETSGMLTEVEVDVLPEELRMLADATAAAVATGGVQYFPGRLSSIADQAQTAILANGGAFQPEVLQAIIAAVRGQILAGASDLPTMAQKSRAVIIDSGAKFSIRGLRSVVPATGPVAPPQIVEIISPTGPSHFLQLRVDSTRPWPVIDATSVQLFLARTGLDALVAWTTGANPNSVFYASTQPNGGWSSQLQLQLSPSLTMQQALQVLEQRIY